MNEKKLHFMHFPKTAGTSLSIFLEQCFRLEDICPFIYFYFGPSWVNSEFVMKDVSDPKIQDYRFFKGHLGWIPRIIFSKNEIETITFLRNPIDRTLSLYNHIRGEIVFHHDYPKRWNSFDEFIFDPIYLSSFSNQFTKLFCLDLYYKKIITNPFTYQKDNPLHFDLISSINLDIPPESMLNLAIERLHLCEFVGLTERFEESFEWMCMQYEWLSPKIKPQKNISPRLIERNNLTSKTLNRVMEINELDLLLYHEAIKIFDDRTKIRHYYDRTKVEKKFCEKLPNNNSIQFNFENIICGEGWDEREGKAPHVFCWTNQTVSKLYFPFKGTEDLYITFNVIHSALPDLKKVLIFTVNSHQIPLVHSHIEGGISFEGVIPNYILCKNSSILELAFTVPNLMGPTDSDKRKLGFACKTIEIKPLQSAFFVYREGYLAEYYKAKHLQEEYTSLSILLSQKESIIQSYEQVNDRLNKIRLSYSWKLIKPMFRVFRWLYAWLKFLVRLTPYQK